LKNLKLLFSFKNDLELCEIDYNDFRGSLN